MPGRVIEPTLSFYAGWDVHEGEIIRPSFSLDTQLYGIIRPSQVERTFLPGGAIDPRTYVGRTWFLGKQQYACLYQGYPKDQRGIDALDRMAEERMLIVSEMVRTGQHKPYSIVPPATD
jgi:hypothetical protein